MNNLNLTILNVGWGFDLDDNAHPLITFDNGDGGQYKIYDHPSDGWMFIDEDEDSEQEYPSELVPVGYEIEWNYAKLDEINDDLLSDGWRGATEMWYDKEIQVGKLFPLNHKPKGDEEDASH